MPSDTTRIFRIRGWAKYQHYKDRNPPWIKLHNEMLHSRTWVQLDDASKALAIACMLLASRTDNQIPADPDYIQRVAYLSERPDLSKLAAVDFIEFIDLGGNCKQALADASKVLANRTTEGETETEAETYKAEKEREKKPPRKTRLPADWQPSDKLIEYCQKRRPDLDPATTFEDFRDYYHSHGRTMADWDLTAMRWVRNEKRNAGRDGQRETAVQARERRNREALGL